MIETNNILFFADRLPPLVGGMEIHAAYFIEYFQERSKFNLEGIITKNPEGEDCTFSGGNLVPVSLKNLNALFNPALIFFNSGGWIEELQEIRKRFPKAVFIYRTGGNEIIKAPLLKMNIPDHNQRQNYWAQILNSSIDLLITNSTYTEERLKNIGIKCKFAKCVGGVNTSALRLNKNTFPHVPQIVFCGARFVPYKNHTLLISVIHQLILHGLSLRLRLAGDGPLLEEIKRQVQDLGLSSYIKFLGNLSNQESCREIASANVYMQLSTDQITKVPGGYYVHSEGMGRSILEALTAGTFVIAGRSGALNEVVTPDRGILVDVTAPVEHIIHQIHSILKHLPSRAPFLRKYCWSQVFKKYEFLFEEKIHENSTRYRKMQS